MQFPKPVIPVSDFMAMRAADDEIVVIDCRFELTNPAAGALMYAEGHIPGALYADLNQDLSSTVTSNSGRHPLPDIAEFASKLGTWGVDEGVPVIAYDQRDGAYAARLWWLLRWLGHPDVAVLDGGFEQWRAAGGDVTDSVSAPLRRKFEPHPGDFRPISTEELLEALSAEFPPLLLDARGAERFRGDVEPIDARGGHIPGAKNWPFTQNLDARGHWKGRDDLLALWDRAAGAGVEQEWIAMCGSGVTACHLALAAEIAGISPPRLYIGSWSEWIRDSARPIARGAN